MASAKALNNVSRKSVARGSEQIQCNLGKSEVIWVGAHDNETPAL